MQTKCCYKVSKEKKSSETEKKYSSKKHKARNLTAKTTQKPQKINKFKYLEEAER